MPDNSQHTTPIIEISRSPEGLKELAIELYGEDSAKRIFKKVDICQRNKEIRQQYHRLKEFQSKRYAIGVLLKRYPYLTDKALEKIIYYG